MGFSISELPHGIQREGRHFIIQFPPSSHLIFIYLNDRFSSPLPIENLLLHVRPYSQHYGYRKKSLHRSRPQWGCGEEGEDSSSRGWLSSTSTVFQGPAAHHGWILPCGSPGQEARTARLNQTDWRGAVELPVLETHRSQRGLWQAGSWGLRDRAGTWGPRCVAAAGPPGSESAGFL